MPFDENLANRIRNLLKKEDGVSEKKMFGGICFMHRGNMICGVEKNRLMLRVGADQYKETLKLKHTSVMDLTGVPLKGFIFVAPVGIKENRALKQWLKRGLKFTSTLPEKIKKTGVASLLRGNRKKENGPTLLSQIKNFGPVTRAEFNSMGITTLEQVKKIGFEEMCRKYVMYYPERLNANAFLGIICSIENTVWTQATPKQRSMARQMAQFLRREYGLVKKARKL
ncbi:MAG: TfoX/Sxy family protein [Bdellovibrionales bacterium]